MANPENRRLATEYGLKLLYKRAFNEVLSEEQSSRDFGPLLGKMGVVNEHGESAMDADQWEAASRFTHPSCMSGKLLMISDLYMAFAFQKQ